MSVRLVATFTAAPGKAREFAQAWAPITKQVQHEPGCLQYELFSSLSDPQKLVLLERWTDQAALDVHTAAMRASGPSPTTPYRVGDTVLERYTE